MDKGSAAAATGQMPSSCGELGSGRTRSWRDWRGHVGAPRELADREENKTGTKIVELRSAIIHVRDC
jgi:hypothetical protein